MKTIVTEVDPAELDVSSETETSDDADGAEERTFGPKIKLTVEVDEETFDDAIDQAFRKIAKEIRVPGFRKGKVPRQVLESHTDVIEATPHTLVYAPTTVKISGNRARLT